MSSSNRKRWLFWLIFSAAVIAAFLFLRCSGYGFGGGGGGSEVNRPKPKPSTAAPRPLVGAPTPDAAAPRCAVRVDATGVTLAGAKVEIPDLVARCSAGVELTVTGDARYGDAQAVRDAVRSAGIDLLDRSR